MARQVLERHSRGSAGTIISPRAFTVLVKESSANVRLLALGKGCILVHTILFPQLVGIPKRIKRVAKPL